VGALLQLRDVAKCFRMGDRDEEILHGIDLDVCEGEFVALMGPSGSGKTTCLEILGALSRPTRGSYHLDGDPVHRLDDDALADLRAARMGFVFQTFNLMPRMSALRNAALPLLYAGLPRGEREARARRMLERVGLGHRLDHRPGHLSGGERRRVALCRLLLSSPDMLLLDEPTNHLDLEMRQALSMALVSYGGALVVISHDRHLLRSVCDDLLIVHDGRVNRFDHSLDEYPAWLRAQKASDNPQEVSTPNETRNSQGGKKQQRQVDAHRRRQLKPLMDRVRKIERDLASNREELESLNSRLADSSIYSDPGRKPELTGLIRDQASLKADIETLEWEWLEASEALEQAGTGL